MLHTEDLNRKVLPIVVLGTALAVFSPMTQAEGTRLTGDALIAAVSGKSYTGTSDRGRTWEIVYKTDGTTTLSVLNTNWSDSGTWEIKDDLFCSERTKRAYMCFKVVKISDNEYHWIDDRGQTTKASGPQ